MSGGSPIRLSLGCRVSVALVALVLSGPAAASADRVEIVLVPTAAQGDSRPDPVKPLAGGRIHLFGPDDLHPRRSVPSGEPFDLPAGRWLGRAEAPGFVSARPVEIVASAKGEGEARRLLWPVVPACRVHLAGGDVELRGVGRVDVVSATFGATTHLPATPGAAASVPAGRAFAYSVNPGGSLSGLGRPFDCVARSEVTLSPPRPPARSAQDLLVRLVSRGPESPDASPPHLELRAGTEPEPRSAALTVHDGTNWVSLFYALPGDAELALTASGREVRTRSLRLAPAAGTAREAAIEVAPRRTAIVAVDYRPARAHGRAVLELLDCGEAGADSGVPRHRCRAAAPPAELVPGLHDYRFDGLDDGRYLLDARVDGEWIPGLGSGATVSLATGDDEDWSGDPIRLEEQHVFGEIRVDGRAVPGELRVRDAVATGAGSRRFPTDDDAVYHFYYFARQLDPRVLLGADHGREREAFRGYSAISGGLDFCAAGAGCSALHPLSTLIGSGRLDFDLGRGERRFALEVFAADSGEPIPDAWVVHRRPEKVLLFERGEVSWLAPRFSPGGASSGVDADGRLVLRLPVPAGEEENAVTVTVGAEGFRERRAELEPVAPEAEPQRVELERVDPAAEPSLELTLPGGRPAASAVLLMRIGGGWASRCAMAADARGRVLLRGGCAGAEAWVVLHPGARLELRDAAELHAGARVELAPAPTRPLAVRVVDGDGNPLPGQVVELAFGRVTLTSFDLMRGGAPLGQLAAAMTDARGRILLPGVDPQAPGAPHLSLPGSSRRIALHSMQPGDTVELAAD